MERYRFNKFSYHAIVSKLVIGIIKYIMKAISGYYALG
jgi:hypothetical protein